MVAARSGCWKGSPRGSRHSLHRRDHRVRLHRRRQANDDPDQGVEPGRQLGDGGSSVSRVTQLEELDILGGTGRMYARGRGGIGSPGVGLGARQEGEVKADRFEELVQEFLACSCKIGISVSPRRYFWCRGPASSVSLRARATPRGVRGGAVCRGRAPSAGGCAPA